MQEQPQDNYFNGRFLLFKTKFSTSCKKVTETGILIYSSEILLNIITKVKNKFHSNISTVEFWMGHYHTFLKWKLAGWYTILSAI